MRTYQKTKGRRDGVHSRPAKKLWNTSFPSFFKEGWLRPLFCLMGLSLCGDGVVEAESGWHFHHLPQIHENRWLFMISDWFTWIWVLLLSRRRIFQLSKANKLQKSPPTLGRSPRKNNMEKYEPNSPPSPLFPKRGVSHAG